MKLITTFRDLEKEIQIYENRIEDLKREHYAVNRIRNTHKIDLNVYVDRETKLNNEIAILEDVLDDKKQTQQEMLYKINQLDGLEYKIAYKRFIEGKTLIQIAEELKYTYQYIKERSAILTRTYFNPTEIKEQA